ncbi:GNAT family N-acetyltransferase [Haoranjiania flava]|uniref:RteC domain-containing protein n=1 Tax=Haoranjiania flava TaxID=1856322 RepID=A0AAE3LKF8_9BACT|nr:GNAT family N-acetyltransferase [Haoranjiania flava]MCU7694827.1 RteC domain-containing protein [Haoranjiania flava]
MTVLKAESIYWIAFYDSIPVGYAKIKLDFTSQLIIPPKTCYLDKIYVVNKFISKEIGKELHKILMQEIIALKYQCIWLSVVGIRKISLVLERLFQITLGDLHHSFHRMKYRSGSRTAFLAQLKFFFGRIYGQGFIEVSKTNKKGSKDNG